MEKASHPARNAASLIVLLLSSLPGLARGQDEIITRRIDFFGNRTFSSATLQKEMTLKAKSRWRDLFFWTSGSRSHEYSEVILRRDLERLVAFYNREGFMHAKVDSFRTRIDEAAGEAFTTIFITEGPPVFIRKLELKIAAATDTDREKVADLLRYIWPKLSLKRGERYRDAHLLHDREVIYDDLANIGYPYARVVPVPHLDREANLLDLALELVPGPFCVFGTIEVRGNRRVPAADILKQLDFKTGQQYNQDTVRRSQAQIYQLGVFQFVTIQMQFSDSSRSRLPVLIRVREAPTLSAKFGIGYGREDKLRGSIDTQLLGLGGARSLHFAFKRSDLEPFNFDIELVEPAFPERKSNLSLNPFYRKERNLAFEVDRVGASVIVRSKTGRYTNAFVSYTLEQSKMIRGALTPTSAAPAADLPQLSSNKSAISLGISRNSSYPLFSPERGTLRTATITLSGLGFESVRFARFVGEHRQYHKLGARLILAHRVQIGILRKLEKGTTIPKEERFYSGGSNSVRGWRRLALGPLDIDGATPRGGNLHFEGNLELRFPLWGRFSGASFWDFGNVWNDRIDRLRYAVGAGLRFDTVIGPARFDIGIPVLEADGYVKWDRKTIHLSIGHAF